MRHNTFKNQTLEQIFARYKWARNNTIKLFESASKQDILDFTSVSTRQKEFTFQSILFQFQCLVGTTNAYYRKIINHKNKSYGLYIEDKNILIPDKEIPLNLIKPNLSRQLKDLESLLKNFDDKEFEKFAGRIVHIGEHEYLHQGQLILMFREAGADLPESYRKAWAL